MVGVWEQVLGQASAKAPEAASKGHLAQSDVRAAKSEFASAQKPSLGTMTGASPAPCAESGKVTERVWRPW